MKRSVWLILLVVHAATAQKQVSYLTTDNGRSAIISARVDLPGGAGVASFEIRNGMILLQASLNEEKGYFILDTGAPQLIVNQPAAQGQSVPANSCNGAFNVQLVKVSHFRWAGGSFTDAEAVALDLSHLEKAAGRSLAGIIGYEQLKNFEVLIDYRQNRLTLFDPAGGNLHRAAMPQLAIPFTLQEHLPVIAWHVGNKTFQLGLDTGAGGNLFDEQSLQAVPSDRRHITEQEELRGLDQTTRLTPVVQISNISFGNLDFGDMPFLTADFRHLRQQQGFSIDGLLGFPFFENMVLSINYPKQKLFLWSGKGVSL